MPSDEGAVVEIEYTLEVEDMVAFHWDFLRANPRVGPSYLRWPSITLMVVVSAVFSGVILAGGGKVTEAVVGFFMLLIPLFLVLVLLQLLSPWLVKKQVRAIYRGTEGRGELRPRSVCLTPEGIGSVTQYTTWSVQWPAVEKMPVTAEHVFFYTGPTEAVIVPRRAFASEGQFAEFIDQARRYQQAHRPASGAGDGAA